METLSFKAIELNPKDMLVTHLPDYFAKRKSQFDTNIAEHQSFDVGIISHIGSDLDVGVIGKVIYFHSNLSETINLKGFGVYQRVSDAHKILIRRDQDINNH